MMIQIDALPAFNDNYLWLLQDAGTRRCAVVDRATPPPCAPGSRPIPIGS